MEYEDRYYIITKCIQVEDDYVHFYDMHIVGYEMEAGEWSSNLYQINTMFKKIKEISIEKNPEYFL